MEAPDPVGAPKRGGPGRHRHRHSRRDHAAPLAIDPEGVLEVGRQVAQRRRALTQAGDVAVAHHVLERESHAERSAAVEEHLLSAPKMYRYAWIRLDRHAQALVDRLIHVVEKIGAEGEPVHGQRGLVVGNLERPDGGVEDRRTPQPRRPGRRRLGGHGWHESRGGPRGDRGLSERREVAEHVEGTLGSSQPAAEACRLRRSGRRCRLGERTGGRLSGSGRRWVPASARFAGGTTPGNVEGASGSGPEGAIGAGEGGGTGPIRGAGPGPGTHAWSSPAPAHDRRLAGTRWRASGRPQWEQVGDFQRDGQSSARAGLIDPGPRAARTRNRADLPRPLIAPGSPLDSYRAGNPSPRRLLRFATMALDLSTNSRVSVALFLRRVRIVARVMRTMEVTLRMALTLAGSTVSSR